MVSFGKDLVIRSDNGMDILVKRATDLEQGVVAYWYKGLPVAISYLSNPVNCRYDKITLSPVDYEVMKKSHLEREQRLHGTRHKRI